ncbi:MAG: AraC family transcriptional regulator [Victivallales bacterium]
MISSGLARSMDLRIFAFEKVTVGTWWNYPRCTSPFTRAYLVEDGEQVVKHGGLTYRNKPGMLYLIPPFVPVDYSCRNRCTQYYAVFKATLDDGGDLCASYSFDYAVKATPSHYKLARHITREVPDFGLRIYDAHVPDYNKLIWENDSRINPEQTLMLQGLLRILLAPFMKTAVHQPDKSRLSALSHYMDQHVGSPLTLSDLAAEAKLNPTYLSDLYKTHFGIRPLDYLRRKRLDKAQALLLSGNHTVEEIAHMSGFEDANYFFKVFKKNTGMTPFQFKEKGRRKQFI